MWLPALMFDQATCRLLLPLWSLSTEMLPLIFYLLQPASLLSCSLYCIHSICYFFERAIVVNILSEQFAKWPFLSASSTYNSRQGDKNATYAAVTSVLKALSSTRTSLIMNFRWLPLYSATTYVQVVLTPQWRVSALNENLFQK